MNATVDGHRSAGLPTRVFGRTGENVPILGLGTAPGGFGLNDFDAVDVIHAEGLRAVEILEQSLRDMRTDFVDAVFVHSVGNLDPDEILGPDGALAGLRSAQSRGLARYVGFTAHHWPEKSERILREADVDAVMFALNYGDKHTYDFQGGPLAGARQRNVGVAAMKVYGGAPDQKYENPTKSLLAESGADHERALHYALSLPGVAIAVVGMYSEAEVIENVGYARSYKQMPAGDMADMEDLGQKLADTWKARFGQVS